MKKLLAVLALALIATPAFAAGTIVGSKHDLKAYSTGAEVCVFCHTPHGADTSVTRAPLWNRSTTAAAGTVYVGVELNATGMTIGSINATDAPLCLSCHDGVVTETLRNEPNTGTTVAVPATSASANLGTDMSNDHPIGFSFATVAADTGIRTKAIIEGTGGMAGALSYGGSDMVWCSSCHDVHDNTAAPFLRIANNSSALCVACHIK